MKRDWLAWAALLAALAVTASAEYQLARECGFGTWMAAGVPAALDVYAVRALRVHRDVLAVVVAMIAVNAASHLVTAKLIPVSVPMVVAVSAIAPLVLWRVHALREDAPADAPHPEPDAPGCAPLPATDAPLYRPADVAAPLYPGSAPVEGAGSGPELGGSGVRPELEAAPADAPQDADAEGDADGFDDELLQLARKVDQMAREETGRAASLRRLQTELRIGQPKAQQLQRQMRTQR